MRVNDARAAFDGFVSAAGVDLADLAAADAVDLMLEWYSVERADDADLSDGGDMLLYQWGTYDWGNGPSFQLDITRQLIAVAGSDDDIWQLSVTLHFEPPSPRRRSGRTTDGAGIPTSSRRCVASSPSRSRCSCSRAVAPTRSRSSPTSPARGPRVGTSGERIMG